MDFRNKGVLITGGSRGLGAGLALELAARGARLALVARDPEPLQKVVAAIRDRGGEAHALPADVGEKGAIHPLAGTAQAVLGSVDVVIHNASTLGPSPLRLLLDTECEDLERALAVNLLGPFRLTRILAGGMAVGEGGLVVYISSDAAVSAYPTWGAYGVSKAALDHLGRVWAVELEEHGVRFLSVDPGDMNTALHREAAPEDDPSNLLDPHEVARRLVALMEVADTFPSGERIALGAWRAPRVPEAAS